MIRSARTEDRIRAAERSGNRAEFAKEMRRSGVVFATFYAGLVAELASTKAKRDRLKRKRGAYARARRVASGACMDPRCSDGIITPRGNWSTGSDWRFNEPRPCSCKTTPPPVLPFNGPETATIYGPLLVAAENAVEAASRALKTDLVDAARVSVGARVAYTNKRARAKFSASKVKVPVGTEGVVFRITVEEDGYSNGYGRQVGEAEVTKLAIRCDDGREFWTNAKNCGGVLNGWDRLQGVDQESERKAKPVAARVEKGDKLRAGISDEGQQNQKLLRVFYVRDRGSRQRYGVGRNATGGPFWGFTDELTTDQRSGK